MSNEIQTLAPSLHALAVCANLRPASDARDALRQATMFLAGVYGNQWQPAPNVVPCWLVTLGDVTAQEIADAAIAHTRNVERGKFPPSAADMLAEIGRARERAKAAERERKRLEEEAAAKAEREHWAEVNAARVASGVSPIKGILERISTP